MEIHDINCDHNCKSQFGLGQYTFEYMFKKYIANIHPCVYGDGIPHKEILTNGINQLLIEANKPIDEDHYPFDSERGSFYLQGSWGTHQIQKQRDEGIVIELIKRTAFSYNHYIEHDINDIKELNIQEIIDNCNKHYGVQFTNITNLLAVLGLKKEYNKFLKDGEKINNNK